MAIWNLAFRSRSLDFAIWLRQLVVECGACISIVLWNVLALGLQYDWSYQKGYVVCGVDLSSGV